METRPDNVLLLFGGCLAAALALFFAAVLPLAGVLSLLTPIPFVYCYYRSRLPGLAVALAGALIVSLPTTSESRTLILLFLELAIAGLVLGELLRRDLGPGATLIAATLGVILAAVGIFMVHASLLEQAPGALAQRLLERTIAQVEANLAAIGYGSEAEIEAALKGVATMSPAVLALSAAAVVGLNLALSRKLLTALGETIHEWPSFRLWRTPEPLVWALIAAGLLIVIRLGPARQVGLNLLVLVAVAYFLHGLAIVAFYLDKKQVWRPLRLAVYALLSLQQFLSLAVAVLGLLDLWIDFRRLNQAAASEAES